ncbi:MAG: protein kinase [Acidobacteria bacterium]|nr:protein kinase [Acidobacteriota bacterium]
MTQRIAHYELLERIAEGGMGVVYRARDTRLDRLVALKFLSPQWSAGEEELEQFLHEARAISRLNHPNIATIYAVEEDEGDRFLAFEYLPGGALRDVARDPSGPPPVPRALRWAIHLGRALAHAHRHGIIHRDVKSANALLTEDGDVKLTDFGVAQVAGSAPGHFETAGTAAYMAPEQAEGAPADPYSDMFSFGVLLFELLAGRTPFEADNQAEVLYDIVHTPTPSLRSLRPDAPAPLEAIVERLLQKKPADRYESMDAVVEALAKAGDEASLERTQSIPVLRRTSEPTVAVLPFVDMSPQRDQEVFCDGVAEEILGALSAVEGLKVVSRGSSFQFKGQAYDVREIGERLGVETVLEGSVRKHGDKLRISVQHVQVSSGRHLWADRFDRDLGDVFQVQDEIAQAVAASFRLRLARAERHGRPTESLEAYDLYLSGRWYLNQRRPESIDRAIQAFRSAVQLDSRFAPAAAGLAEAYVLRAAGSFDEGGPQAAFDEARAWARRAVLLDKRRSEAYVALALVALRADWDFAVAEASFKRAIALNPSYATARHQYAMYLAFVMRIPEALEQIRRAHELDPLSPIISTAVGRILHFSRDYEAAMAQCRRTLELDPSFVQAAFDLLVSCGVVGLEDEARKMIDYIARMDPDPIRKSVMMARFYGVTGDLEAARAERVKIEAMARDRVIPTSVFALVDIGIGEIDRAVELFFDSVERKDQLLLFLQCEPTYDPIRSHPRYAELMERIGFPKIAAAVGDKG